MNIEVKINRQAYAALYNPTLISRIENCILNARTELAKRRLVQTAYVLGNMKYL